MVETPRLSIVIPFVDRKSEVIETLYSLRELDIGNSEIIIIDDGSETSLTETEAQQIDKRIRVIRHTTNRGGSAARNSGIDAARAPFVAFLDSDDRWLQGKIDRQLSVAASQPDESRFLIASNVLAQHGAEKLPHNYRGPGESEDISTYLMDEGQAIQTSTMLLPTWIAREVRFRDGLARHQDWDFILRLKAAGVKIIYDDEPLAIYNVNPDPRRVTLQRGRLAVTLAWYKLASPMLSRRAMQRYFVRSLLGRDGLKESRTALMGLTWLSRHGLLAAVTLALTIVSELTRKLRNRYDAAGKSFLPPATYNSMRRLIESELNKRL